MKPCTMTHKLTAVGLVAAEDTHSDSRKYLQVVKHAPLTKRVSGVRGDLHSKA